MIEVPKQVIEESARRHNFLCNYNPAKGGQYEECARTILTEEYESLLLEELSIADKVKRVVIAIKNLIYKDLPNLQPTTHTQTQTYILQNYEFIGYLPTLFHYTFCDDESSYNEANKNCWVDNRNDFYIKKNDNSIYRIYNIILNINCPLLNGKIDDSFFYEVVFHEVEHIYQLYHKLLSLSKKGQYQNANVIKKEFLNQSKGGEKRQNLYNFAIENLVDNVHSNHYVQRVCWVFYLSGWNEQDGFVNQMYGYMMKIKGLNLSNFDENLNKSEAYNMYLDVKKIQKKLPNWGQGVPDEQKEYFEMVDYLKQHGISFNKNNFQTIVDKTVNRFGQKIQKGIEKIKVDKRFIPGRTSTRGPKRIERKDYKDLP